MADNKPSRINRPGYGTKPHFDMLEEQDDLLTHAGFIKEKEYS